MAEMVRKKIYQCKACECSFSRNTKLQQHMATHTPEENMLYGDIFTYCLTSIKKGVQRPKQKIACPVCPMIYVHRGHHKKHLQTVHGVIENPVSQSSDILPKVSSRERSKIIDGEETVSPSGSISDYVAKSETKVHFGPLHPEETKIRRKRGRPPKGKFLKIEFVKDNEGEIVKVPYSSSYNMVKGEKKVHFGLLDPEQIKKKRGRPSKIICLKRESGSKFYECPQCKKRMTQSSTLSAHMRIHTGERPYRCLVCSKTFTFYQCLWNHSWRHKTMKCFPCDRCPRTFRYYQCLWTHYKTHTDKRLYKCAVCKLGFATSVQLIQHKKKHPKKSEGDPKNRRTKYFRTPKANEMPFKCEVCFKKFKLKISLISHKEKCFSKRTQLSLEKSSNNNESDIFLASDRAGFDQIQKRCRGRPRKFVKPQIERRVFVNFQTTKDLIRKRHDICLTCKKVYQNCVCHVRCRDENKRKRNVVALPFSTKIHDLNFSTQSQCSDFDNKDKMAGELDAQNKDKSKKFSDSKKTVNAVLRRSERLKREKAAVSKCKTYDQSFICSSKQNQHMKCHAETKPYNCSHCSKSFKFLAWHLRHQNSAHIEAQKRTFYMKEQSKRWHCHAKNKPYSCSHCSKNFKVQSWLVRHQNSAHSDTQKKASYIKGQNEHVKCSVEKKPYHCSNCSKSFQFLSWLLRHQNSVHIDTHKEVSHMKLKKNKFRKKLSKKGLERKCSCCGTIFISDNDYKKHTVCVSCICGQQFQCAYIFCFHTSTCGENSVSVGEEVIDQKFKDTHVSSTSEGNFSVQQDMGQPDSNTVFMCGNSKSPQIHAKCISLPVDTSVSAPLPSSNHYQSDRWWWQLINTASIGEVGVNGVMPQAKPNGATDATKDSLHVQDVSGGSELQRELQLDEEEGSHIQISRHLPGNRMKFQCMICSHEFSSESELAIHSLSHVADSF